MRDVVFQLACSILYYKLLPFFKMNGGNLISCELARVDNPTRARHYFVVCFNLQAHDLEGNLFPAQEIYLKAYMRPTRPAPITVVCPHDLYTGTSEENTPKGVAHRYLCDILQSFQDEPDKWSEAHFYSHPRA